MTPDGIVKRLTSKQKRPFVLSHSAQELKQLVGRPPDENTVIKLISLTGGFASLSFIRFVADFEPILELTVSTLRIGEKQFDYLAGLAKCGKLTDARFFVGSLQERTDSKAKSGYNYFARFENVCRERGWVRYVVNNHSKIILMRTQNAHYVLESSSNLNDNPKIEQYSFENDSDLYAFYSKFFDALAQATEWRDTNAKAKTACRRNYTKREKTSD